MKLSHIALSLAGLATLSAAPALAQERPEVQELANRWTSAYNSVDAEGLGDLYGEDAELYIHNAGRYIGRGDIGDFWAADMGQSNPITVLTVTDSVSDPEMILVHGNYQVLDRVSGVPLGFGRFAHIWVLEDGDWVLDRDVWMDARE